MKKTLNEQLLDVINAAIQQKGSLSELARSIGTNKAKISKWVNKEASPNSADVAPVVEMMGARLVLPDEKLVAYDFVPKVTAKAGTARPAWQQCIGRRRSST